MGIILYEFLVGCVPFFGDTPEELFGQVISGRYCPRSVWSQAVCVQLGGSCALFLNVCLVGMCRLYTRAVSSWGFLCVHVVLV